MQEEFVTCTNCGKEVPDTQFCIECGFNMARRTFTQEQESETPVAFKEPPSQTTAEPEPERREETTFIPPYEPPIIEPQPILRLTPEDSEIIQLTNEMTQIHLWKIKLLGILSDEGMNEKVFRNVYRDYSDKISTLRETWENKIGSQRRTYEEKRAQLQEAESKFEEMKIRVAVGEFSDSDLLIQTPRIRENIEDLKREIARLEETLIEPSLDKLRVSPLELFEHEQKVRQIQRGMSELMAAGRISEALMGELEADIIEILKFLSSLVRDSEETELRNEMETLDVRFKIGEISESELDSMKREIMAELDRIWNKRT